MPRGLAPLDGTGSFSVRVVLPASGCEMMANVRRRAISCSSVLMPWLVDVAAEHDRVLAPLAGLVIAAAHTDLLETEGLVEPNGRGVGWPGLEERLARAGGRGGLQQVAEQAPADGPRLTRRS